MEKAMLLKVIGEWLDDCSDVRCCVVPSTPRRPSQLLVEITLPLASTDVIAEAEMIVRNHGG